MNLIRLCIAILLLLAVDVAASAQLSVPPVLDGQFSDSGTGIGLSSEILRDFVGSAPRPGLEVGAEDDITIRNTRGGVLLNDVHGYSGFESVTVGQTTRGVWATLVNREGHIFGQSTEGTEVDGSGAYSERGARVGFPIGRSMSGHVDFDDEEYVFGGTTDLYANLFNIFPATPPFRLTTADRTVDLGVLGPISRSASAELTLAGTSSPGAAVLANAGSPTLLRLPLSQNGVQTTGALRWRLRPALGLAASLGYGAFSGSEPVERESDRSIGSASSTRQQESAGLAAKWRLSPRRNLTISFEGDRQLWSTNGLVPNAADVGITIPGVTALSYGAGYHYSTYVGKVEWVHEIGENHELRFSGAYGHLAADYHAGYGALDVILPIEESANIPSSDYYGEVFSAAYRFPIKGRITSCISASQALPALGFSHHATVAITPAPPPRTPSGGEELLWTTGIAF